MRVAIVLGWASLVALGGLSMAADVPQAGVFSIDPAASHVVINVGRAGMLGFAGHDHAILARGVTGRVTVDPADWQRCSVSLDFDTSSLEVSPAGEPPADVPEVQRVMLSDRVLDVKRFPVILFRSRRVTGTRGSGQTALAIEGDLTLHGVKRPLTIHATVTPDAQGLTARGSFSIRQTDFGIQPVTAGGGTVKVKDELDVQFQLAARRQE